MTAGADLVRGWADTVNRAWAAQQAAVKPDPVIIVAGTTAVAAYYEPLAARLRAHGYDVHIYQLKGLGMGDIRDTTKDFAAFADQVRAETGASKVDLIAHSQGGLVARQYVKFEGGADHVDSLIGLASPNHGTNRADLAKALHLPDIGFASAEQMAPGSEFLRQLNDGDDTIGDVRYTNFYSTYDGVVRPVRSAAMDDGATNVLIQDQAPLDPVGHLGLPFDPLVENGIEDALRGERIDLTR